MLGIPCDGEGLVMLNVVRITVFKVAVRLLVHQVCVVILTADTFVVCWGTTMRMFLAKVPVHFKLIVRYPS